MRRIFSPLLHSMFFCMILLLASSCKSKPKVDPNRPTIDIPVTAITAIEAHEAITVKFVQSDGSPKITVTSKKAYANNIDVKMEGTTLVAQYKNKRKIPESGVEVVITAPGVNKITATSAAIVNLGDECTLKDNLTINTSSAGSVKCRKLECYNLTLNASSTGQILLSNLNCHDVHAEASSLALIALEGKATGAHVSENSGAEVRCDQLTTTAGK